MNKYGNVYGFGVNAKANMIVDEPTGKKLFISGDLVVDLLASHKDYAVVKCDQYGNVIVKDRSCIDTNKEKVYNKGDFIKFLGSAIF